MKYVDSSNQQESKTYEFGGLRLEAENLSLFRNGEPANGSANDAKQLTAGFEKQDGAESLGWMPGGRIVYQLPSNEGYFIWSVGADGNS